MDKNLHDIENLFRKELEGNEETPSPNTWGRIDKILDRDKILSIDKKYASLKKIVFLLMFFLIGLSIYVWNIRQNNGPEKKDSTALNNEAKTKDNKNNLPDGFNKIDLKKSADTLNKKDDKNQNSIADILPANTDENILKPLNKKPEKTVSSDTTETISIFPVSKSRKKSEKTIPGVTNNNIKSSITKQGKTGKNKWGIKTPALIKTEHDVAVKHINIDSTKTLISVMQLNSFPDTKIKNSTTDLIETKKLLQATVPSKPALKINNSKNIFQKQTIKSQFYVTGFFSPEISFFRIRDNQSGNQSGNTMDAENSETRTFSYTIGALIEYKTTRNWSWQSGLTLSTTNMDIDPGIVYAKADNAGTVKYQINTSSGYSYILPSFSNNPNIGDSIFAMSTTNTLQYLGIPLSVKYSINKGKFTFNAMTGISANFLTQGKITTEVEKGNNSEMETSAKIIGLKKFYLSGIAGVGLDYNFYKNLSADFSPTFRFALNPINRGIPVKSFPNSFGFSMGLKLKL